MGQISHSAVGIIPRGGSSTVSVAADIESDDAKGIMETAGHRVPAPACSQRPMHQDYGSAIPSPVQGMDFNIADVDELACTLRFRVYSHWEYPY
jgi:hypothetical protein